MTRHKKSLFLMFRLLKKRDLVNLKEETINYIDYYGSNNNKSSTSLFVSLIVSAISGFLALFLVLSEIRVDFYERLDVLEIAEGLFIVSIIIAVIFVGNRVEQQERNDKAYIYYKFKLRCLNEFIRNRRHF